MVRKAIAFVVIVYVLVAVWFYVMQRVQIYVPAPGHLDPKVSQLYHVNVVNLTTKDGLSIKSWYRPAKPGKPTLLYLPGNYGHLSHRAYLFKIYPAGQFGLLLVGYRGFSGNPGKPTEQGLYNDGRAAVQFLRSHGIPLCRIVLFGDSLGSGVAVQLATEFHVGAVILKSPYSSLVAVGEEHYPFLPVSLFLKDRYESINKIDRIDAPLLIVHGNKDRLIPVEQSEKLYQKARQPKQLIIMKGKKHNTLLVTGSTIASFLAKFMRC